MSSTLSEGVRVPDIGSVNWGADVNYNWGLLNTALANISGNVKTNVENTWTATQTFTETISGSIDGVATRAVGDEDGTNIKSAIATKAADNAVVHLAGAETITGDKTFTGSVATHNVTPETDNTYSLGSASYQWASVYAQTYYYNGTAWGLDKANVWSNEQTILQSTSAQLKLKNSNIAVGDEVPSSQKAVGSLAFTGSNGLNIGFMDCRDSAQGNTFVRILARQKYDNNGNRSASGTTYESGMDIGVLNDTTPYVAPTSNAMAQLGTSTNKWKTLNGVNPGALSFPRTGNTANTDYIDVSGSIDLTTTSSQTLTASATGWLCISFAYNKVTSCQLSAGPYRSQTGPLGTSGYVGCVIPVTAGQTVNIRVDATALYSARIYLCQGNV